jgi:hypothetical protein
VEELPDAARCLLAGVEIPVGNEEEDEQERE